LVDTKKEKKRLVENETCLKSERESLKKKEKRLKEKFTEVMQVCKRYQSQYAAVCQAKIDAQKEAENAREMSAKRME